MKTTLAKKEELERNWFVVDASEKILGRMAVKIADVLRGRHKPIYTPHVDAGDFVVVVNAEKVALSGNKEEQKQYMFYSGYVGNEKYRNVADFRAKRPTFIIENAVKGMMPKNRLARQMLKKLKIYAGPDHPHEAQNPQPLEMD
ncbi:MAG: 50S ribosomal protein L13 [Opitutae bacterium]|nr:50S ribosomal protein L13 [Opitutae bacterium]